MNLREKADSDALTWDEIKPNIDHIKRRGLEQFIALYNKYKDRQDDPFKWGDEIEYMIIKLDSSEKVARISLRSAEILKQLRKEDSSENQVEWQSECGSWMLEGVPGRPHGQWAVDEKQFVANLAAVEKNMNLRRQQVKAFLNPDEVLLTLSTYPRLGCPNSTSPDMEVDTDFSLFTPPGLIYMTHRRYISMAVNMQKRLGRKMHINIPVFRDVNTADPSLDAVIVGNDEARAAAKPYHVYMDSMMSGFGCCSLQITVQAANLAEARHVYDHWNPLCPILLALSAASSPINRGYLIDYDTRWSTICQSVDDRLEGETYKPRFGPIEMYLSPAGQAYNDVEIMYDKGYYTRMVQEGVDPVMAKHMANTLLREPIAFFREELHLSGDDVTVHVTNLLAGHWPIIRFKPPPSDSTGWRVEFRPVEVQLSDFENAAYAIFVRLISRLIATKRLFTLMPMSKVDENIITCQQRDAVRRAKFWFRSDLTDAKVEDTCQERTINEIINGSDQIKGIIPLINAYLDETDIGGEARSLIDSYLKLISDRASGTVVTTAQRIREFVVSHLDYKGDSVVSDVINYDLMVYLNKIAEKKYWISEPR
ncbi:Glutamate--cysteine ligase catalytic subunit [Halotydeus destructor]|nr:Glutamate--cysteine ligase catalytic subunit [Halotydeus destructor]